eukprot:429877-Pelagomonas_calceolata.AAC.1
MCAGAYECGCAAGYHSCLGTGFCMYDPNGGVVAARLGAPGPMPTADRCSITSCVTAPAMLDWS